MKFLLLFLILQIQVSDIRNNLISIFDSQEEQVIIIFYNDYHCKDCMLKVSHFLNMHNYNYKIITRCSNDIITKKKSINNIKKIFNTKEVYFDSHEGNDPWPPNKLKGGLFEKYDISITPAILVINNGKQKFFSYTFLFPDTDKSFQEIKTYLDK